MYYRKRWTPSKATKQEFAQKMSEVDEFCRENHISSSASNDSYYFEINGRNYRVSNHSVESSNAGACRYDEFGNRIQVRDKYHPNDREDGTVYIHASKTRIIEIYTDLKNGYELDGRGNRKKCVPN